MGTEKLIEKLDDLGIRRDDYSLFTKEPEKYCILEDSESSHSFFFLEKTGYKSCFMRFNTKKEVFDFVYNFFLNNKFEDSRWVFQKSIKDGEKFELEPKVNIWDYEWVETENLIKVKDFHYKQSYLLKVLQISIKSRIIEFLANEVANGSWIIYRKLED